MIISNESQIGSRVVNAIPIPALDTENNTEENSKNWAVQKINSNEKVHENVSESLMIIGMVLHNRSWSVLVKQISAVVPVKLVLWKHFVGNLGGLNNEQGK